MDLKGPYTPRRRCLTVLLVGLTRAAVWGGIITLAVLASLGKVP